MFSGASANVLVEHHERRTGKSNYGFFRILELVTPDSLHSSYPLRFVSGIGVLISVFSFVLAGYYFFSSFWLRVAASQAGQRSSCCSRSSTDC